MEKYNSGKIRNAFKQDPKSLAIEIIAVIAIAVLVVAMILLGANKGGTTTSIFARERDMYVLEKNYSVSELDFDQIGSTENNLRLSHEFTIDLNGHDFDLNGYTLNIVPTYSDGLIAIKNGKLKNGTLVIDTDGTDVLISDVVFDNSLRYVVRTSYATMTINSSAVSARNIKCIGGVLELKNSTIDDISLTSDLTAEGSKIGTITTTIDESTIKATDCTIGGVNVKNNGTVLEGEFDCTVDITSGAVASADDNRLTVTVKDQVKTIGVNTNAHVILPRDGENEYGATVGMININATDAIIDVNNCSRVDSVNAYADAQINIAGAVGTLNLPGKATVSATESAIVETMTVDKDATIDFSGTVYKATIKGSSNVRFARGSYVLDLEVTEDSTSNINLACKGATAIVYNSQSKMMVMRETTTSGMMIIDGTNGTAQIQFEIENEKPLDFAITADDDISFARKEMIIPVVYVDSTCLSDGYIKFAPGANAASAKAIYETKKCVGHKYENITVKKETTDEDGIGKRVCTICGEEIDYIIPRQKVIYSPDTIADYLGLLLEKGDYDYSLDENSGYILNYTGKEEGGDSSAEVGEDTCFDILFFKKCYVHFTVEKFSEQEREAKTHMRVLGAIDIDAYVLKDYQGIPIIDGNIDETQASEVVHYQLTGALKDSILAYEYHGPDFVFMKEGHHYINFTSFLDMILAMAENTPDNFDTQDLINAIETVRKLMSYFERYGTTFKILIGALFSTVNIGSLTPDSSFVVQDQNDPNKYYVSFEHLVDSLSQSKGTTLNTYINGLLGDGMLNSLIRYAYGLPNEKVEDIYSTLCFIADNYGGMSEDELISNFNMLLSILLNDALDNLPGDIGEIKNNIKKYFGASFDIRNAVADYGNNTIYELVFGIYEEDPQSEDPKADYQLYLKNKEEFEEYWGSTINTIDSFVLESSIEDVLGELIGSFGSYTDVFSYDEFLVKLKVVDNYFDYEWYEDGNGHKLTTNFNLYVPDNIDDIISAASQKVSEGTHKVMDFLAQHIPFFAERWGASSSAEGEEPELIQVLTCTYDNQKEYFINFDFEWLYMEKALISVKDYGVALIETEFGSFYVNNFNINISQPVDDGDDIVLFNCDLDGNTLSIKNLESNLVASEDTYFIFHNYDSYIIGQLAVGKLSGAVLSGRADYKAGHLSSDPFVIADDATPTSVIKDKFNLFDNITLNLTIDGSRLEEFAQMLYMIPFLPPIDAESLPAIDYVFEVFKVTFDSSKLYDGKQGVLLTAFMDISKCTKWGMYFDDEEFYVAGNRNSIRNEVMYKYGILSDEFTRNDKGQIRGASFVLCNYDYEKVGGYYEYVDGYSLDGIEFKISIPSTFKFVKYEYIAKNYSIARMNEENTDDVIIMTNGDVYVESTELNHDFTPSSTGMNRWRKNHALIGNVNDNPLIERIPIYQVDAEINYDPNNVEDTRVYFIIDEDKWAHFTEVLGENEYSTTNYHSKRNFMDGELTPYKLSYHLYTSKFDEKDDVDYMNWENEDGVYVYSTYVKEGGDIIYDEEKDEISGQIFEYLHLGNNEYLSRVKYEVVDEKFDGERKVTVYKNNYKNYAPTIIDSTDLNFAVDIVYGDRQDAWNFIIGSELLFYAEMLLYSGGIINSIRSLEEINELNLTEIYQVLVYKNRDSSYSGISLKIYDVEFAGVFGIDEIMLKADLRHFGYPLNVDIYINRLDIINSKVIVQYDLESENDIDVRFVGSEYEVNATVELQSINYLNAHRNNWTDEWTFQFTLPLVDEEYMAGFRDDFTYYQFSVIYGNKDIDVLWGRFGRMWQDDNWLTRALDIPNQRDVFTMNYDRETKIFKADFTILQLGTLSLHANLLMSPTYFKYVFSLIAPLAEEVLVDTAGKQAIKSIDFITVTGNPETGAYNFMIYLIAALMGDGAGDAEELLVNVMKDPNGDNGFCIFNYDSDYYKGYSDDLWKGMEYMAFVYNLNNYTCDIVVRDYVKIQVELDENDPTIRNAYIWVNIIQLERTFQIVQLEDGRLMATSKIWDSNQGVYVPTTFVISYVTTELDDYYEVNANIENGLGTGAYYVGQMDYIVEDGVTTIFFTLKTDIEVTTNIEAAKYVYIIDENGETKGISKEDENRNDINTYYDSYLNIPISYDSDGDSIGYDFTLNFNVSTNPQKSILNKDTENEIPLEDFCDQKIEEMFGYCGDTYKEMLDEIRKELEEKEEEEEEEED